MPQERTKTLIELLLLSDFGRLRPDRAHELVRLARLAGTEDVTPVIERDGDGGQRQQPAS